MKVPKWLSVRIALIILMFIIVIQGKGYLHGTVSAVFTGVAWCLWIVVFWAKDIKIKWRVK